MLNSKLLRTVIAVCLVCALLAATHANLYARGGRAAARTHAGVSDGSGHESPEIVSALALETDGITVTDELDETNDKGTPAAPSTTTGEMTAQFSDSATVAQAQAPLQGRTIIVNDRTLAGPHSSAQQRGGRIFLPLDSIARALGDVIKVDMASRMVEVRRQTGTVADFSAQLNQVRENGSVILSVSNTADIVFPPNANELMLPVEIVSALLDVSVRTDEAAQAIRIMRGQQADTVRAGAQRAAFELYQVEYDYNLNRYSSDSNQNLTLRSSGRLWDGRFNLLTNSSIGSGGLFGLLRNFTFTFERPNGQRLIGGDFGTGTDLLFMSSTVRGASAQARLGNVQVTAFGGRSVSGVYQQPQQILLPVLPEIQEQQDLLQRQYRPSYDTNIFGAYATFGSSTAGGNSYRHSQLLFSAGMLHFNGPNRSGEMITGSARYASARSRLQGDVAVGRFKGTQYDTVSVNGIGLAADLSASFDVTDHLTLQGRYRYVGANFLGPQSGLHDPVSLASGGVTWRPANWITASVTGSFQTRPGALRQRERFIATTLNITPRASWPTIFLSHTQSNSTQVGHSAYTLLSAAKNLSRWSLYLNATRIKTKGTAFLNAQLGANLRLNEYNTLQLSQSFGSRNTLAGTVDWQTQSLLGKRLSLGAGFGYNRSNSTSMRTTERLFASFRLPRQSTLQLTYLQSPTGPQLLLSLRGLLLRPRHTEVSTNAPLAEINSYGSYYGRVYQDINLNGRFDPGLDKPQANVKVRVDGNRYVVADESGRYRIDNVHTGEHNVYLDLLTVRADLTLLDGAQQSAVLIQGRDSIVDFRLVRTGRINGTVWLDTNGDGQLDAGEQPLAGVRLVAGSGRDTLTDENGVFRFGDLPPGEHVILVDEKTLPEKTVSTHGTRSVKILAGSETGDVNFPITAAPPEIKRFPSAGN